VRVTMRDRTTPRQSDCIYLARARSDGEWADLRADKLFASSMRGFVQPCIGTEPSAPDVTADEREASMDTGLAGPFYRSAGQCLLRQVHRAANEIAKHNAIEGILL
jgi:hypothetical protein